MTFTIDSDLNGASPQFTLTCISTGGPATTVTWTRDSEVVVGSTVLDDAVTATYTHTLTVTGRTEGLYRCSVSNSKPSSAAAELSVAGIVYSLMKYCLSVHITSSFLSPPVPSPPSGLSVSQNGLDSALVLWTAPSGGAAVTGYIIYYQQEEGGQRLSESAEAAATTASITGLIAGATYSITMVATSSTLPSTETAALTLTIGTVYIRDTCIYIVSILSLNILIMKVFTHRFSDDLPQLLSPLPHRGWRLSHSHLLCHSACWSNWYSRLPVGGAWSNSYPSCPHH